MGAERLRPGLAALLLVACHAPAADPSAARPLPPLHLQIVRALTTAQRGALVDRFVRRNDGWTVSGDAVEPFRGFLKQGSYGRTVEARAGVAPDAAAANARTFVERNADVLGVPAAIVPTLVEERGPVTGDGWIVLFTAAYPAKGYETLRELRNEVELAVRVGDDGVVTAFENRSRLHPALVLDTHPALAPDNPAVVREIVGRRVFAVVGTPSSADMHELPRIALGAVRAEDVQHVDLAVDVSPGPANAYVAYRLAYRVVAVRGPMTGFEDPFLAGAGYYFRWLVDADTGQVVEDTAPAITPERP